MRQLIPATPRLCILSCACGVELWSCGSLPPYEAATESTILSEINRRTVDSKWRTVSGGERLADSGWRMARGAWPGDLVELEQRPNAPWRTAAEGSLSPTCLVQR